MTATARKVDTNGFLLVKGCPLSSVGIFDYSAGQLGLDGDPMRIVKVYRPESSVTDPAFLESLRDMPLVNDHEMLSGFAGDTDTTAPEEYGIDGVLTSNIYYKSPWAYGDIKIFSRTMQADLKSGKKDLSLGYACEFEEKPGIWMGQAYEVVQSKMICNHLALVGEGRVPGARVLDGLCFDHLSFDIKPSDKEPSTMPKPNQGPKVAPNKVATDSAIDELKQLMAAASALIEQVSGGASEAEPQAEAAAHVEPSAEPGAEPAAEPTPDAATGEPAATPAAEPEAAPAVSEGGEGGNDLTGLIAQVKAVLAKLEAASGASEGANVAAEPAADNVEGLQESSSVQGAQVSVDGEGLPGGAIDQEGQNLPASATAQDAALRGFYADAAVKDSIYQRLSKVVGAFDCRAMDARQVSVYGVKKLGLKCQDGHEMTALNMYLDGRASGLKTQAAVVAKVQDSKTAESAELDAYLKGEQ